MSNTWTITLYPPFRDDRWAYIEAKFVDGHYFSASSREQAIETLRTKIDSPDQLYGNEPPAEENITVTSHPDFETTLSAEDLHGQKTQLGLEKFGTETEPWYKSQEEYHGYLEPLLEKENTVLTVKSGDGVQSHPSEWDWNYSVWIHKTESDPARFDCILHRTDSYDWTWRENLHQNELTQILIGEFHNSKQRQLNRVKVERCREKDISYAFWEPNFHAYEEPTDTPFSDSWDFCPGVPSEINGWIYDPSASLAREVWRDSDHAGVEDDQGRRVEINHNYAPEYSFGRVFDARVGGAKSAMHPGQIESKFQSEMSPAEARAAAVDFMEQTPPEQVQHPGFDERFYETPPDWSLSYGPTVGSRSSLVVAWRADVDAYAVEVEMTGTIGGTDFELEARYYEDGTEIAVDDDPVPLRDDASAKIAHSQFESLAKDLSKSGIPSRVSEIKDQSRKARPPGGV
jgi:hypothetical protein